MSIADALVTPRPESWRSPLRRGMHGPDVASWQRVLVRTGHAGIRDDGDFGRLTEKATMQWQAARGLTPDGVVGGATRTAIGADPGRRPVSLPGEPGARWPLVQAVTFRWRPEGERRVRLIVIHSMENAERPDTAEAVAAWFGGLRGSPPRASAHVCIDSDSIVRCVRAKDDAAAAPGANGDGYHVELAGRAAQGEAGWSDAYSMSMLELAAGHCAEVARAFGVPMRRLTVEEVRAGVAGFCGHVDVSRAFGKSTHTDPGPHFPWTWWLGRVAMRALDLSDTERPGHPEDDPPTDPDTPNAAGWRDT